MAAKMSPPVGCEATDLRCQRRVPRVFSSVEVPSLSGLLGRFHAGRDLLLQLKLKDRKIKCHTIVSIIKEEYLINYDEIQSIFKCFPKIQVSLFQLIAVLSPTLSTDRKMYSGLCPKLFVLIYTYIRLVYK